jgi:hypothetical protein
MHARQQGQPDKQRIEFGFHGFVSFAFVSFVGRGCDDLYYNTIE